LATQVKQDVSKNEVKSGKNLILEAHHTTQIEGSNLSLHQSGRLIAGEKIGEVDSEDVQELLNYKKAFYFVADYLLSPGRIFD
jgi:Fic family protein